MHRCITYTNHFADNELLTSHAAFAVYFLATSNLVVQLGPLNELARSVNIHSLSLALIHEFSTSTQHLDPDRKLWLLAHFISIHRLQQSSSQDPDYLRALSLQLSSSSSDILNRIDAQDLDQMDEGDVELASTAVLSPLPPFIKSELLSLVDKDSISGLLEKFNIDYVKASAAGEEDASLLASYALTLLRIFPRRADDIRMWLYLGSMNTSDGAQIPALKFFWQAMSSTNTFSVIRADSKAALTLLRPQTQRQSGNASSTDVARDREWRTILLFLELYTFVLRFTDDEAFMSGSVPTYAQASRPISRIHESALPIQDVKLLTLFLKNLAFTAYYNAGELVDGGQNMSEGGIGTYFGANANAPRFSAEKEVATKQATNRPFAGIAGMTFDYVRTIVTGVMQQLYERDSRRQFLPKDHWLMTSRFDMEGFIPAVVMEEERQHRIREEGEDEDFEDEVNSIHDSMTLVGMSRPRRAQQIEALRYAALSLLL